MLSTRLLLAQEIEDTIEVLLDPNKSGSTTQMLATLSRLVNRARDLSALIKKQELSDLTQVLINE